MRVLVIDFEKFSQTVFESELHQQNIEVDLAVNGEEGLDLIKKNKPDLIVLELILPKINGFDLLAEIKKYKGEVATAKTIVADVVMPHMSKDSKYFFEECAKNIKTYILTKEWGL